MAELDKRGLPDLPKILRKVIISQLKANPWGFGLILYELYKDLRSEEDKFLAPNFSLADRLLFNLFTMLLTIDREGYHDVALSLATLQAFVNEGVDPPLR